MKKLKSRAGMTLVELLCVVAILVLVSAMMATGIQLGARSYRQSVTYSDAQMLCSTLTTAVGDELRYARDIESDNSFFSSRGDNCSLIVTEGHLVMQQTDGSETQSFPLVPEALYAHGIQIADFTMTPENGIFTVTLVISDSAGTALTSTKFQVLPLNQPPAA